MDENFQNSGNILTIQTIQIAPFRTLMTALKDILIRNKYYVLERTE